METLASQLAALLPEVREPYGSCGRKVRYGSLGDASRVALRRKDATGELELYCYPCDRCDGWHLSHLHPTPQQLAQFEAFAAPQQRKIVLEMRQLRRQVEACRAQITARKLRFHRLLDAGYQGTPFPSRITAYYTTLRQLLHERLSLIDQYRAAVFAHDAHAMALDTCREFSGPCASWREAVEQRVDDLAEHLEAMAQQVTAKYVRDLEALHQAEREDLEECRKFLNARYGASC